MERTTPHFTPATVHPIAHRAGAHGYRTIGARFLLAAGLATFAGLKAAIFARGNASIAFGTSAWLYGVALGLEALLAVGLLLPKAWRMSARVTAWGFLGAGAGNTLAVMLIEEARSCVCLGVERISQGQQLVLQGLVAGIAFWVLGATKEREKAAAQL